MFRYVEFNKELAETYDTLCTRYHLKIRTAHLFKKHDHALHHLFEFGNKQNGVVAEFVIESGNARTNRGRFIISDLSNRAHVYLRGRLGHGDDTVLIAQIRSILEPVFEGFENDESVRKIVERLRMQYVQNIPEKELQAVECHENQVCETTLDEMVQKALAKGAPLKGYRFSPNRRTVLMYKRKDGSIDERFFINIKECVAYLQATYLLDLLRK